MARIGWAVMMRQADCRNRRHDQPGPDLGEPGPTDQVRGLKAHVLAALKRNGPLDGPRLARIFPRVCIEPQQKIPPARSAVAIGERDGQDPGPTGHVWRGRR